MDKLAELTEQLQQSKDYPPTAELLRMAVDQHNQRVQSGEITEDEKRAKLSTLFHGLIVDNFSEVFPLLESQPVFKPYTANSSSSFEMEFRHKIVTISLGKDEKDPCRFAWRFSVKPSTALKEDFQQWHERLNFSDDSLLKNTILAERSVNKDMANGSKDLLALLIDIEEKYQDEMATFESIKGRALRQQAIVNNRIQCVEEWNYRLRELQAVSQDKVKELISQAKEKTWFWPEGEVLTLFHIIWQRGCGVEGGIAYPDLTSGWSLSDVPDAGGYFDILPEIDSCSTDKYLDEPNLVWRRDGGKIKPALLIETRKVDFATLEELPLCLRIPEYLTLEVVSFSELVCRKSGLTESTGRRFDILESEGSSIDSQGFSAREFWEQDFRGFRSLDIYHHILLGRVPVAEIRAALA